MRAVGGNLGNFIPEFSSVMFIPHPNLNPRGLAKLSRTYKAEDCADCAGETACGCMTSICKEDIWGWLAPPFERRSVMTLALASVDSPCTSLFAAAVMLVGSTSGAADPVLMFSSDVAFRIINKSKKCSTTYIVYELYNLQTTKSITLL